MVTHDTICDFVFRIAELTRLELLKRHSPRVGNAVVDMNPLGSSGLGENSPHWARKWIPYKTYRFYALLMIFQYR